MHGVTANIYSRKTLEKSKRGLRILKIKVQELFMHEKDISTPRTRHKERNPLIKLCILPFYISLFFLGLTTECPCSYVSSSEMRNSNLHSSFSLNVCVLN